MNRWKRWIIKLARKLGAYGTLDTDKTIRILKTENLHLKQALADAQAQLWQPKPHVTVEIDPTVRQRGYEQSAWNSEPEKQTDKPKVIPNTHGGYFQQRRHEPQFQRTHLIPTFKRPPQNDLFTSAEMTAVRIPTWIN